MHRLYAEGLINEEFLTQPQNVRHALNKVDPTVYGSFIEWDSSMLTMPENTDEYEVILPLKGPDGDQLWTQGTRRLNLNPALVVFQNCENPLKSFCAGSTPSRSLNSCIAPTWGRRAICGRSTRKPRNMCSRRTA